uniref:Uncharacterized protein n=1 Tax=Amphimedon queenslandica TaxID=400682 RepID=A0A1X7VEV9_AMPQE
MDYIQQFTSVIRHVNGSANSAADALCCAKYSPSVTEADILEKIKGHIPPSTRKATSWVVKFRINWRHSRKGDIKPPELDVVFMYDNDYLTVVLPCLVLTLTFISGLVNVSSMNKP